MGALVYLKLRAEHRFVSRDGHGALRATLVNRSQLTDGSWYYTFSIDETGMPYPPPSISGGMIESVCCQGCQGFAAESFNQNSFGERLLAPDAALVLNAMIPVQHMIRAFHLEDLRAWLDLPGTTDVLIHLYTGGGRITGEPLTIPAGKLVSDQSFTFTDGNAFRLYEGGLVEAKIVGTSAEAKGLEIRFWGHESPSTYMSPLGSGAVSPDAPGGGAGGGEVTQAELDAETGARIAADEALSARLTVIENAFVTVDTEAQLNPSLIPLLPLVGALSCAARDQAESSP